MGRMARPRLRAPFAALALALAVMPGLAGLSTAAAADTSRTPSVGATPATGPWTGSVTIWRSTAFASQATTTWCTAAATQIMLNLVLDRSRHDSTEQRAILTYEQAHDSLAISYGSDPQGWAAALRSFGTTRTATYHWERNSSFSASVKSAAYRLRMTGKPIGLLVYGGKHANVMVGFRASADPARGGSYSVTSVQIVGPWYPRSGVDSPPGTWLSSSTLASRFYRYSQRDGLSGWIGYWVTITP
jgi:hypothetical protein